MSRNVLVKGVILAGGTGSRLDPLTRVTNKHLLPVGGCPMICHPVAKLARAGIRDLLVVTGTDPVGAVARLLGSGRQWGVDVTFRVQDAPAGIADALAMAEGFAGNNPVAVLLGDNIFQADLAPYVARFLDGGSGAHVLLKQVSDAGRFGVATIEGSRIARIDEKPAHPRTDLCVTGIYMYRPDVFQVIRTVRPSTRGELEISDVNNHYAHTRDLSHDVLDGWWIDAGTVPALQEADRLALHMPDSPCSVTHR